VFIRAPWVEPESIGDEVEVLAEVDGHAVAVRERQVVLCSFHPELTDDSRVHALLMAMATAARQRREDASATAHEVKGEN
jgi:5'-phosphate synthase pdxT subunit